VSLPTLVRKLAWSAERLLLVQEQEKPELL
jgi:hypothetical protein